MSLKIHAGQEKWLLRRAMSGQLPEPLLQRPKQPFTAPPLSLFSGPRSKDYFQDTLRSERFSYNPFFDPKKMVSLLDRLPAMSARERIATDPVLMLALTSCLLQERFGL